jgi:hypothetical protein
MARAVKVTDGVLKEGTVPNAVTTARRRQMALGDREKGSVLGKQLEMTVNDDYFGGAAPTCEECRAVAGA